MQINANINLVYVCSGLQPFLVDICRSLSHVSCLYKLPSTLSVLFMSSRSWMCIGFKILLDGKKTDVYQWILQHGMNYYYMYHFIFVTCDVFLEIVKTEIPEE